MQVGFRCIRGDILHDACRGCSLGEHPCGYTADILEAMRHSSRDEPDPHAFSPSRLLGCFRQPVLMEEPYFEDVDLAWTMMRGNLIHGSLEQMPWPMRKAIREERMEVMIDTSFGPQRFTAKPDVFVIEDLDLTNRVIHIRVVDYKTREFGHELVEADRNHQLQVNMYAWLGKQCLVNSLVGYVNGDDWTVEVDELEIIYLNLQKTRRFTSKGWLEARGKRHKVDGKWEYDRLDLAPIRMFPMEQVETFIRGRIERKIRARQTLPPPLEGEAAKWCFRCPVYAQCMSLANEGAA
jgi:hypothetical protein